MANASAQKVKGIVEALAPVPSVAAAAQREQEQLELERARLAGLPQPPNLPERRRRAPTGGDEAGGANLQRQSSLPSMSTRPSAAGHGERRTLTRSQTMGALGKSTSVWKALGASTQRVDESTS